MTTLTPQTSIDNASADGTASSGDTARATLGSASTDARPPREFCDALAELHRTCRSRDDIYRQSLRLAAAHFNAPYAALRVERTGSAFGDQFAVSEAASTAWRRTADGLMLNARYQRTARAMLFQAKGVEGALAALSVPLAEGSDGVVGSLFLAAPCRGRDHAEDLLRELKAIATIVGLASNTLQQAATKSSTTSGAETSLLKASQFKSLHEMAYAICHNLKNKLGCEQVALGLVAGRSVDILCISGFDDLYPRSPGARVIRQAMCECLDARQSVSFPPEKGDKAKTALFRHRLHEQWHNASGHAAVASIPLMLGDEVVAVLSFRNALAHPISAEHLNKIAELIAPFAPGLLLMEKASRSAARHVWHATCELSRRWTLDGAWGRRLLTGAACLGLMWAVFGRRDYIVSAPCTIVPSDVRQITSPYDATLAASFVKPGDEVRQGALLARLDTRQLSTERNKLLAEVEISRLEATRAAAAKNLPMAAQADALGRVAAAKLKVVEDRIAQSEIRAPSDGVILSGDLGPKIGEVAPMGTLLLEFAPQGAWRVDVQLPEHATAYVLGGQVGTFALTSRPDEEYPLEVARIKPSSEIAGGQNVFVAEASLSEGPPDWVRSGMQGAAEVNTGPQPVWWVWLHRAIDGIRLAMWKL